MKYWLMLNWIIACGPFGAAQPVVPFDSMEKCLVIAKQVPLGRGSNIHDAYCVAEK